MGKDSTIELDQEFVEQLRKASKSGHDDRKIEVLKRATELLSQTNSPLARNWALLNLCTGFLILDEETEGELSLERIEIAIIHVKFLIALVKSAPKSGVQQHAVISALISDLFGILYIARSDKVLLNNPACDEFEHRLNFLCKAAIEDEELKNDIPFIIANNLKAERRHSIAMLTCVLGCSKDQIALLSTNLPTKEKQFFGQLLQRIEQAK